MGIDEKGGLRKRERNREFGALYKASALSAESKGNKREGKRSIFMEDEKNKNLKIYDKRKVREEAEQ